LLASKDMSAMGERRLHGRSLLADMHVISDRKFKKSTTNGEISGLLILHRILIIGLPVLSMYAHTMPSASSSLTAASEFENLPAAKYLD
jgi:hypothetical protein